MSRSSLVFLALSLSLVVPAVGCSSSQKAPDSAASAASATSSSAKGVVPPGEAKVGDRSYCLVSKEEFVVNADSPKAEYEGKTYYFCCSGCDKAFSKDPKKFLTK
ncbi:MAG: YHS domain-containing protein [Myxococcales bacterium]|nr:YHS domain-containing protein [Myxococcales bacterium]